MKFKTELHCHSAVVSACGKIAPEEIVAAYLAAGYSTVVLTEHFSPATFAPANYTGEDSPAARTAFFLSGYRALCAAAGDKLHVLLGAEVRFDDHSGTDYLVFGLDEDKLTAMGDLHTVENAAALSERVRGAGCLFVQAHPFRNNMKVTDPALLDGMEVFNGNLSKDERNDIAALWAKKYDLIPTSGTDLHRASAAINGGILTREPIATNEDLLFVLRSRAFRVIEA